MRNVFIDVVVASTFTLYKFYLRNKSWKPEIAGSFNIDWRILVFYPEPVARDKFTNIRQSMLKLKTHSGYHDLF